VTKKLLSILPIQHHCTLLKNFLNHAILQIIPSGHNRALSSLFTWERSFSSSLQISLTHFGSVSSEKVSSMDLLEPWGKRIFTCGVLVAPGGTLKWTGSWPGLSVCPRWYRQYASWNTCKTHHAMSHLCRPCLT